ncbi:MAG: PaaI family thioesterase [Phycisphaerae bacterium]|jgi:uncharacterized protein (TIGR00369 family)
MLDPRRAAEVLEAARQAPCMESFGIGQIELDEGRCRLLARHLERYDGLPGGFHGGMMAAVADCVAWFAIATQTGPLEPLVTTDLSMHYLAPCTTDVTAVGQVIKLGRTLCPVRVELNDAAGKMVAAGTVTYIRLSNLRGA